MTTTSTRSPGSLLRAALRAARDPSAALLICQLVTAAVAFVANILAARALEPAGRGELALLLQIGYLASLGLLLGTDRSLVAAYSGSATSVATRAMLRLLRTPSTVGLVVAVLFLVVPGLGSWQTGAALAVAFAVVNAFVRAVRSIVIATGRRREFLVYTLVGEGLRLAVLAALVVAGVGDVLLWMLAYLVVGTLPTAFWLIRWAREGGALEQSASDPRLREARREGVQLLPSAMANSGMLRVDRLLLPGLASTAALGLYASVSTMTELLSWPLLAYADSRLGRWRAAHDAGTLRVRPIVLGVVGYCAAASLVVGAAVSWLLVPLLGPAYAPAGELVVPLVLAAAVFGASQVVVTLLIASRRSRTASVVEIVGFAVSIVAYVVLISRSGALGAAYGSLVGYAACLLVGSAVLLRVRRRS